MSPRGRKPQSGAVIWCHLWLQRSEILGRARASLPYVGMVTILLNDYPALKFVLVGLMALFVLTSKEG